jgi:hypothetical protein
MNFIFRFLLTALLFIPSVTWADRARPPYDYVTNVSGGKYVFVMLANSGFSPFDIGAPDDVGVIDSDKEIRKTYKNSGLYLANQILPLWTVPWYSFTVYPASDGDHLVRIGPWASSVEQLAVSFYSKGVEIKKYLIRDLVKDQSRLHYTVSHFFWMSEHHYDEKTQLFHLKTVDGVIYKFSTMTGEIVP